MGAANQQWTLLSGITLRPVQDYEFCFDLAGGSTNSGTLVQLWNCNGLWNQKWIFENYQIHPAYDSSKCLDAGSMSPGRQLMVWDCNGMNQQLFGFDSASQTIYLSQSTEDASDCIDISGGNVFAGTSVDVWYCNGCWNQQFQVIGPSDESFELIAERLAPLRVEDTCPPKPLPPPSPSQSPSPSPTPSTVLGHCASGDQHGWSVFNTQSDLQNDGAWSSYFETVFGGVPSDGYPICVYAFFMIYHSVAASSGLSLPSASSSCPRDDGDFFSQMSFLSKSTFDWIYDSRHTRGMTNSALPSNYWVEVIHTAFKYDYSATWLYYTPGSAIWFWTGTTKVYSDHKEAVSDLLHEQCNNIQCIDYFKDL